MRVLGTTAAERRHREVSCAERHGELEHVAVRGSADTVERRFEARPGLHGPTRKHEAQDGCAAETWRCQASARRKPLPEEMSAGLPVDGDLGGEHRTTNGHGFEQMKGLGQPGDRRLGDAS
jgi:hypothetical protein